MAKLFTKRNESDIQIEFKKNNDLKRRRILFLFTITAVIVNLGFGIQAYYDNHDIHAFVLTTLGTLFAFNGLMSIRWFPIDLGITNMLIVFGLGELYIIFTGGVDNTGFIWFFLTPVISFLFFSNGKKWIIYNTIFLSIAIYIITLPPAMLNHAVYSDAVIQRFIVFYISLCVALYIKENAHMKHVSNLSDRIHDLTKENNTKDSLLADLPRQLRTPLNIITIATEMLKKSSKDDSTDKVLDRVVFSTNDLVSVVNNIVEASNIDLTIHKPVKVKYNLNQVMNDVIAFLKEIKNVRFDVEFTPVHDLYENVEGDPTRIKQIVINILENLNKCAIRNISELKIEIDKASDKLNAPYEFTIVIDKITSVREHLVERAFLEQVRSRIIQPSTLDYLDFTIAQKVINYYMGSLETQQVRNAITLKFALEMECVIVIDKLVEEVEELIPNTLLEEEKEQHKPLDQAEILLVEDNDANKEIVILSIGDSVSKVEVAKDGLEAVEKIMNHDYDLILMDIQMPNMSGIDATKTIRKWEKSRSKPETPIIALTANALSGDREKYLDVGMNDYISKPFQIDTLLNKMKRLI